MCLKIWMIYVGPGKNAFKRSGWLYGPIKIKRMNNSGENQSLCLRKHVRPYCKENNALKKKYNKFKSAEDWEIYRFTRKKIVSMRRKSHLDSLCDMRPGNSKEFWRSLRPFMQSRKNSTERQITIKENQNVIRDQRR